MQEKQISWIGDSNRDVKRFPKTVRQRIGLELQRVQFGLEPIDWKPMRVIGPGAREIRVRYRSSFRIVYVAHFDTAIFVLHAFKKDTQETTRHDIALAKRRYKEMLRQTGERDERSRKETQKAG